MSPNRTWAIPILLVGGIAIWSARGDGGQPFSFAVTGLFHHAISIGLTPAQISSGEYIFLMQSALAMASLVALIPAIVVGERERTLAELRESEERFKNLVGGGVRGDLHQ